MTIKDFFGAINMGLLTLAFAFSVWAEWGPYAWIAELQLIISGSYDQIFTIMIAAVAVLVPGFWLLALGESHAVRATSSAIIFLCTIIYLGVALYFLCTTSVAAPGASFASAVRAATIFPQPIALNISQLPPMDVARTVWVVEKRSRSKTEKSEFYLPFMPAAWPDAKRPVILRSTIFDTRIKTTPLEGNIRIGPIPFLVRRNWPSNTANLCVIIAAKESVQQYWLAKAVFSTLFAYASLSQTLKEISAAKRQSNTRPGWRRLLNEKTH